MLDLTITNKSFMAVKMPNGEEIRVLPPKRKLMSSLQQFEQPQEVDDMYNAVAMIMSNNRDEKKFSVEDIDVLDIGDIVSIFTSYSAFMAEIQKN